MRTEREKKLGMQVQMIHYVYCIAPSVRFVFGMLWNNLMGQKKKFLIFFFQTMRFSE